MASTNLSIKQTVAIREGIRVGCYPFKPTIHLISDYRIHFEIAHDPEPFVFDMVLSYGASYRAVRDQVKARVDRECVAAPTLEMFDE